MAVDASDKLKFCVVPYKKRLLAEYRKSFEIPIKKLKVDDGNKKEKVLKIKIKKTFQEELPLVEKSVEKIQWKSQVEEKRLQTSLKRDTNKCSRELAHKKVHIRCVKNNEGRKEVESKVKEFRVVTDNIDKEPKKKEEELKAISMKIARCNKDLESGGKMLISQPSQMKDFESKNKKFESREKKLESKEKQCERQLRELELKEEHYKEQVKKLKSRKCSRELVHKKVHVRCVKNINEIHDKILVKVEECVTNFVVKEAQLYLIEDLVRERKVELENKDMELHKVESKVMEIRRVMDNVDKERKRKEEEFEAISLKIAGCTEELESGRKMLMSQRSHMKDFDSKNKKLETREEKLESKERECERQVKELELKEKHFKERVKELETKERKLEGQVKDFESKKEDFEGKMNEFKSKLEHLNSREKKLISKEKQIEEKLMVLESKEKQYEGCLKEFESDKEYFEGCVMELDLQVKELKPKLMHFERLAGNMKH